MELVRLGVGEGGACAAARGKAPCALGVYIVASVCSTCLRFFRRILQVFHVDVTKLDLVVAILRMLHRYVASTSTLRAPWRAHPFHIS